ncbi:hypothetical protein D8B26_000682 [Coccidioides posadasii str. Silveira]|uniref:Uncharacterized protein n=2 Tax=Coccidioides posadasii TaxID=199306 RepID=E9D8K3_COCPS|nr:conserved hypothetical protein [Coccidioides posadasii str. Silveira]KMM63788.1 hypothetical protein CPAG_00142 [Coccidioides posadasii RMSCC 3488]QVM05973.1 hypothetical protein D8B26_000682 [Coccidioides posadasii str. Silveira]
MSEKGESFRGEVSRPAKILYINAYDAPSSDLISQLQRNLGVDVDVCDRVKTLGIKGCIPAFPLYDAVVVGLGDDSDVWEGSLAELWDCEKVPMLAVGVPFLDFCFEHHAGIEKFPRSLDGTHLDLVHCGENIFKGLGEFKVTPFYNYRAGIRHLTERRVVDHQHEDNWYPSTRCSEIAPLAWCSIPSENQSALMAAHHLKNPIWAIYFRLEACKPTQLGSELLKGW